MKYDNDISSKAFFLTIFSANVWAQNLICPQLHLSWPHSNEHIRQWR